MASKTQATNLDLIAGNATEAARLIGEVERAYLDGLDATDPPHPYVENLILAVKRTVAAVARIKVEIDALEHRVDALELARGRGGAK